MQIKEAISEALKTLGDSGALLDVELVLAQALGVERSYFVGHDDEEITEGDFLVFNSYIKRLVQGEPVAYITHEKEFFGLDFFVDKRVLIPRPETEHIVEEALKYLQGQDDVGRKFKILDVGTGSGCIPIAILKSFEGRGEIARADMVDISSEALEVAKINGGQYSLEDLTNIYESDLISEIADGEYFDVITANLPYVGKEDHSYLAPGVEKFEPHLALFAGSDGMELYNKMFQQLLAKNIGFGVILGEFGFGQGEVMREVLNKYFDQFWEIKEDLAGIERMFIVRSHNN